mmetsp:Transcript_77702/g.161462  ORF Transcript_77702/g.161462 Transcript_77702/m.161462 type:complete len:997 (-) Transcript_77702:114-3104(-)
MTFGDGCTVGENAVCTSGCATGNNVTLQPLSLLSGRTARTLPDGSVWKGAPLVQSRGQRMEPPEGVFWKDFLTDFVAIFISLAMIIACACVGYCVFGILAQVQGFDWKWQETAEGWEFASVWLLFGAPVMASADVLLGIDVATYFDQQAKHLGDSLTVFALRIILMTVISFAANGWALTASTALLCRVIRGSRRKNSMRFQLRRIILRMTYPRYPMQLSGTAGMALYLRMLGAKVALSATVAFADPPLEPRKMHMEPGSFVLGPLSLGEMFVRERGFVGGGAVLLPHAEVEARSMVGGNSVVGLPVRKYLALAGNPGVVMHRPELNREPRLSSAQRCCYTFLRVIYPVLAPMLLQLLLLVTLLPPMALLTVIMNSWQRAAGPNDISTLVLMSLALSPTFIILGWCLCLVAVLLKWVLVGRMRPGGEWQWQFTIRSHVVAFVQGLTGMSVGIYMGMAMGSPMYNRWLRMLGADVAPDATILTTITDFDCVTIEEGASIDKDANISGLRLVAVKGEQPFSEYVTCLSKVRIGARCTVSHAAVVAGGETAELSVLAPLTTIGHSAKLPSRTMAVGSPAQKFTWSKDRDNLLKPSSKPLPRELNPPIILPTFVSRALSRRKVLVEQPEKTVALVTGASGFLGRFLVAAMLQDTSVSVICIVRAANLVEARKRTLESLKKAGVPESMFERVEALPGDLAQRNLGLAYTDFQQLAGKATHVFHCAAKVNLTEPFELMRRDNIDATAHLLEFCCTAQTKAFHHISTMGILTPDMLDRHGRVEESAKLGDMRCLPMYGTGDQANGYPYTKWVAEAYVFEAANRGLPAYVHRPGLIGGHSESGYLAQDVFFHFLSDVVKSKTLPAMEGAKFNITPVDWVARTIVGAAFSETPFPPGSTFHPAANNNTVTMDDVWQVLEEAHFTGLRKVEFTSWRDRILANPDGFKSWSFCAALTADGDGIDSMAGNEKAGKVMRQVVGETTFDKYQPKICLKRMFTYCRENRLFE